MACCCLLAAACFLLLAWEELAAVSSSLSEPILLLFTASDSDTSREQLILDVKYHYFMSHYDPLLEAQICVSYFRLTRLSLHCDVKYASPNLIKSDRVHILPDDVLHMLFASLIVGLWTVASPHWLLYWLESLNYTKTAIESKRCWPWRIPKITILLFVESTYGCNQLRMKVTSC